MSSPVIEVSNLSKYYGGFQVLDSISLSVERGWIYGYLGPNGAGKTTTIRTILGLLKPDAGYIEVLGFDPRKNPVQVLSKIGYAPEIPNLPIVFTGNKLLDFMGRVFDLPKQARKDRVREMLELVGLSEAGNKKIGKYSKGMIQRLSLAIALINDPPILIMDEPTIGMDPEATATFRDLFSSLSKEGKTLFISSHLLDEVQRICSHVGMIKKGKIIFSGSMSQVLETFTKQWTIEVELAKPSEKVKKAIERLEYVAEVIAEDKNLHVKLNEKRDVRSEISSEVIKHGGELLGLTLNRITLEDAYLEALRGKVVE
jgi:ABC-2 type transport system ATP-binding protein